MAKLSATNQGLLLAFSAVLLGVLLSALQTPLYRILEGYYLPERWRDRWIDNQRQQKHAIQEELKAKRKAKREATAQPQGAGGTGAATRRDDGRQVPKEVNTDLLLERVLRYPVEDQQIAPTRLANGIRAFETYGYDRFWLDSQALWTELLSVVPEPVRTEQGRARAGVDFFVSLVYLFALLGCVVLATELLGDQARGELLVTGVVCLLLVPAWYQAAVTATANWRSSVQALVNVGRKPLAEALGLELPQDLAQERDMWRKVGWLTKYRYDDKLVALLQPYRRAPSREDKATGATPDGAARTALPAQPAGAAPALPAQPAGAAPALPAEPGAARDASPVEPADREDVGASGTTEAGGGGTMTFRVGFLFGFAVGYVLGAKAGEERYQQIVAAVRSFRENSGVEQIAPSASTSLPPGPVRDDTPPYEEQKGAVGDEEPQAETARTVET